MGMEEIVIVGSVADNPVAEDIAHYMGQQEDYQDLISLKSFLNTEFCPRFITGARDLGNVGDKLKGKTIILVSTNQGSHSRNGLGMRNFLIARAAKDNGAQNIILVEPDLYYSAQDRGPRKEHGLTGEVRTKYDYEKFDGQPFVCKFRWQKSNVVPKPFFLLQNIPEAPFKSILYQYTSRIVRSVVRFYSGR